MTIITLDKRSGTILFIGNNTLYYDGKIETATELRLMEALISNIL